MKEITPKAMRCSSAPYCPSAFEIAPDDCVGGACPTVAEVRDTDPTLFDLKQFESGVVAVIGKHRPELVEQLEALKAKCGPDEDVVFVPKELLKHLEWAQ